MKNELTFGYLLPQEPMEKKKKLKRKLEKIGYDKDDKELKALMVRRKSLLKEKLTIEKKKALKKEIIELESPNKKGFRHAIGKFLSPQENKKRKDKYKDNMNQLNKQLAPLMKL